LPIFIIADINRLAFYPVLVVLPLVDRSCCCLVESQYLDVVRFHYYWMDLLSEAAEAEPFYFSAAQLSEAAVCCCSADLLLAAEEAEFYCSAVSLHSVVDYVLYCQKDLHSAAVEALCWYFCSTAESLQAAGFVCYFRMDLLSAAETGRHFY
jgi:hypothetical protein